MWLIIQILSYLCFRNICLYTVYTTGNDDYESGPFNVTIPSEYFNMSFNISIINNSVYEDNETFIVTIDPYTLPSRIHQQPNCNLVVTIVDDDSKFDHFKFTKSCAIMLVYK